MKKEKTIKLSAIKIDAGTQSRAAINEEVVAEYAERMLEGDKFPPIVTFFDGTDYFLADGFHRYLAASRNKFKDQLSEVHGGTRLDALIYSLGANRSNGLRRTNADKRHAVELALADPDLAKLSDHAIAKICGVSQDFVSNMRRQVKSDVTSNRIGLDGKSYPMSPSLTVEPGESQPQAAPSEFLQTMRASDAMSKELMKLELPQKVDEVFDPESMTLYFRQQWQKAHDEARARFASKPDEDPWLIHLYTAWRDTSDKVKPLLLEWIKTFQTQPTKTQ